MQRTPLQDTLLVPMIPSLAKSSLTHTIGPKDAISSELPRWIIQHTLSGVIASSQCFSTRKNFG